MLVVMWLKTSEGFLKGQFAHNDRVDSNFKDTGKMFSIIIKIEYIWSKELALSNKLLETIKNKISFDLVSFNHIFCALTDMW